MRRTSLAVASLLATATLLPVSAGQASAPAERQAAQARISLSAPSTVAPHSRVTLTGRTGARRGAKVRIYQRPLDRASWNLEGTTRVKKRGKFRYSEGVTTFSRYYKACVGRSCSPQRLVTVGNVPTTPPPPPATPQAASLTLVTGAAPEIEAGQTITVGGTASANLAGKPVALQAYDAAGKTWGNIATGLVDAAGSWTLTGPIGTAGKIGIRVYAPPSATTLETAVGAGVIAVYGWYPLGESKMPSRVSGYVEYGPATINAVPYATSVTMETSSGVGSGEWNLARSCKTFTATVGLLDTASTTTRYSYQLFSDSVQKATKDAIALGTSNPVSIDVTNALRLRIATQRTAGSGYDYLVFGDAKALCSF
ncbi:NPCBM/NEW2 domain-containing protein [Nocardioides currus]|uniref:Glycosyl hydrolase family 98 putative carbohydrate-binding module domain-containing protein n=1 Tax=Nocardioides currus TaxID=2133958 RepID=A0A2R7YXX8_9ACTN|nr:NPCBM/NEW2 domain-containing protein [Nocardioides currus]PUA81191.1 hypothetical protein C7S10_09120 [Nocardioides currus]